MRANHLGLPNATAPGAARSDRPQTPTRNSDVGACGWLTGHWLVGVLDALGLGAAGAAEASPEGPAARASPNQSPGSAAPGTPELSWVNSRPPLVVSPLAEPGRTLTAPASATAPTSLNGAPAARSAVPSWLKSAVVNAAPKLSPASIMPPTWVINWLPVPASPPAPPYSTLTAPALPLRPTSSNGGADRQVVGVVLVEVGLHAPGRRGLGLRSRGQRQRVRPASRRRPG